MGIYKLDLVGESFGDRQTNISKCKVGQMVVLKREPNNPHSKKGNAILVTTARGKELGYISEANNAMLAKTIDKGTTVAAKIDKILGGTEEKPSYGLVIEVYTGRDAQDFKRVWKKTKLRLKKPKGVFGGNYFHFIGLGALGFNFLRGFGDSLNPLNHGIKAVGAHRR